MMAWFYLFCAGVFEMLWVLFMKHSAGFTKLTPSCLCLVSVLLSLYLLGIAIKTLPLHLAYAIWTGIGVMGITLYSIVIQQEPMTLFKISCLFMLVCSMIGLKLASISS